MASHVGETATEPATRNRLTEAYFHFQSVRPVLVITCASLPPAIAMHLPLWEKAGVARRHCSGGGVPKGYEFDQAGERRRSSDGFGRLGSVWPADVRVVLGNVFGEWGWVWPTDPTFINSATKANRQTGDGPGLFFIAIDRYHHAPKADRREEDLSADTDRAVHGCSTIRG